MNRRDFLYKCGMGCALLPSLTILSNSCTSTRNVEGILEKNNISIPLEQFVYIKKEIKKHHEFIIINHPNLNFPIAVFRLNEKEYKSIWMQCPHQGATLQLSGNRFHCPAHGSEFQTNGQLIVGPAMEDLRILENEILGEHLKIKIK